MSGPNGVNPSNGLNGQSQARRSDAQLLAAIAGAVVGFLVFKKPLMALVGAAVGYAMASRRPAPPRARTIGDDDFLRAMALIDLMAFIGSAQPAGSGPLDDARRRAMRSYFERDLKLGGAALERAAERIEQVAADPPRTAAIAAAALEGLPRKDRLHALFVLFRVALADMRITPAEEAALAAAARAMELSDAELADMRAWFVFEPVGPESDYRILSLEPGASMDEVKERYREAVRTYHPDRFQHLGAEFAAVAETKFKAIHAAYERLCAAADIGSAAGARRPRAALCANCRTFTARDEANCIRCGAAKLARGSDRRDVLRCAFCTQLNALPDADAGLVRCGNCKVVLVR